MSGDVNVSGATHLQAADSECCGHAQESHTGRQAVDAGLNWFRIPSMDCAAEEAEIRLALEGLPAVQELRFRLAERQIGIGASGLDLDAALVAIRKAGFSPTPVAGPDTQVAVASGKHEWLRLAASLVLAMVAEGIGYFFPESAALRWAGLAVAAAAIALAGSSVYLKGLTALRQGRLNINALMTVAVTGAFLIGQWPEAAMVMALYAVAEAIEARALDRARRAIRDLMSLAPEVAEVEQSAGQWLRMPSKDVRIGSVVRVRPGERLPLDGVILRGNSAVNQAPVTGESLPVDKGPGDAVYAGTINQDAALEYTVSALASDSTLARIIIAVEQAQATRAPTQRFVDRFAAIYTPAVFLLALAVALFTPWLLGWTWLQSLYKALVLLVIACPCALVISTPVTVVSGLAAAARRGILIKGGVYLEQARKLRAVALDKTGTITRGEPRLVAFEAFAQDADQAHLQRLAASLASRSDHPVSKAIAAVTAAALIDVNRFEAVPGRGVCGEIDGQRVMLANHRWVEELGLCSADLEQRLKAHEQAGRSVTLLATQAEVLVICAVADTLKSSATEGVAALRKLGLHPVMLTGDNATVARTVAAQAGIVDVRAQLLPQDKLRAIEDLQRQYGPSAMIGDGINDAPALAKSDLGFAMGAAGAHTAMEAAGVVIMNDDISRVAETVGLSKRTHAVLLQNITLALGIKVAFLLLALFGSATMWMAVFADMGASLLVVFNGLRLALPRAISVER